MLNVIVLGKDALESKISIRCPQLAPIALDVFDMKIKLLIVDGQKTLLL